MLNGFETDLKFLRAPYQPPIQTEDDLELYASRVAGTVGELCCWIQYYHFFAPLTPPHWKTNSTIEAAKKMGKALQLVNVARDIWVDATLEPRGRVYIPQSWLQEDKLSSEAILNVAALFKVRNSTSSESKSAPAAASETEAVLEAVLEAVAKYRQRLLDRARTLYDESRPAIEELPEAWGGRRGMRAAIESYMEIGRVLGEQQAVALSSEDSLSRLLEGKATVPRWRRVWVFFTALAGQ